MSDDTLLGILLIAVVLGSFITVGVLAARRSAAADDTPVAPTVRRRRPIRSRTMRAEHLAPDRLSAHVARIVRTAQDVAHRISTPTHAGANRADVPDVPDSDLPRSPQEVWQLAEAVRHKQRGLGKAEAIERAFGVKKGGNPKYTRLARMFDLATNPAHSEAQYRANQERLIEIQAAAAEEG